jgi:Prohead core protein serine protease
MENHMTIQLLTEHLTPIRANLSEQRVGKDLYLNGIMMQAELVNGNGRNYPLEEIARAVEHCKKSINEGHYIMGELNHPDSLSINLANVSHAITEVRMDGNNAIGKMKLLNTPAGNIARGIIEGGVRLGVSSRGTGNVNESGGVTDFSFVTVDIVSQPSAPDAYPDVIAEAKGNKKILSLAEAVVHDAKAQAYFKKEMTTFLQSIFRK